MLGDGACQGVIEGSFMRANRWICDTWSEKTHNWLARPSRGVGDGVEFADFVKRPLNADLGLRQQFDQGDQVPL